MDLCYLVDLFDIQYIYKCDLCVHIITVLGLDDIGLFDYYLPLLLDKRAYLRNTNVF